MKKKFNLFVFTFVCCLSVLCCNVFAAENNGTEAISVIIDGERITFDQEPVIINDRTMVPMRKIFETLGADVNWHEENSTITASKGMIAVRFTIDSIGFSMNGIQLYLDSPPVILNGRTMLPVRAVAECFGCDVNWDSDTSTVTIDSTELQTLKITNPDGYAQYYGEVVNGKANGYGVMQTFDEGTSANSESADDTDDDGITSVGIFEDNELIDGSVKYMSDGLYHLEHTSGDSYIGGMENGLFHGYGVFYFAVGDRYEGNWKNGIMSGQCVYYFANGDRYEGNCENGTPHGYGTYYYADGTIAYSGNWDNGIKSGQGICYYSDGSRYEGNWENDVPQGQGIVYFADGDRYEGDVENGLCHGYGVYYWTDGTRYEGNWENGDRQGYGILYVYTGDRYEGTWENSNMSGQGVYYFADGDRYEGNFANNTMSGQGVYYFSSGDRYEGNFENNNRQGYGVYYYANGERYEGNWENSNQHGYGTYYYADGTIAYSGYWENGYAVN